ncbi:MAG: M60 family metallopeptidase [Prosthecobacter sp.]|uniref:M60 family metallopeptidase n=1 Tax=Prosthecobacter sp. TaxID=1965333 RepID=UPI0025FA410A|nr:M60 family metallopeptidase [Prosthecobacter sp.]MCF7786323.1 M60 family metallopeptidase [Prosthecobacter sp.]
MKSATSLILLAFVGALHAQMPSALVNAERAKILEGVKSVPKAGTPGPIGIWGNMAFPILSAPDKDGVEIAVAAAAGYAKGRVILFGHNSYLAGGEGGDHAKLMENCVKWAGNKEKPRVGLKGVTAANLYKQHGFNVESFDKIEQKSLNDYDVVIVNMQSIISVEEGAAVAEYVKGGGGFIGGMTGWAFSQTSGGKDLAVSHGLNQALMPAGIAITDMSAFDQLRSFEARVELPQMMNASEAISAIKKQRDGGPALTAEQMKQATNAIQIALAAQPPDRSNLKTAVLAALGNAGADAVVPTKLAPLTAEKNATQRLRLGMETRVLRLATGEGVAAHPAHEAFPGKVPEGATRVSGEIKVTPSIPGWTSTGLYAAAGDTISVILPEKFADKGYAVRIGCHSDTLYHLDKWERAPDITRSVSLTTATTKTASAFGGLIYIEVPGRAKDDEPFTAVIQNAVPAPLFVLGQDDDAKWSEIKMRPAPWAELACDKLILSCPTEVARAITNPTQLMEFWKKVVEAQDDITNQTAERKRPERIVADVQISAGYMHSGYPIMIPTSAAPEMTTFGKLKFPGWGFYHEIGHNHQRGDFTFDGTGEVTNNVIGMYCYDAVLKKDWLIGHTAITEESRKENIQKIKKASNKWQVWKSEPFTALTTYIQLMQEFGWESWRKYLYSFNDPTFGPAPKGDDERRDQFLVRYSKITNKNLGPFFEAWGIPVSSAAKAEVSKLEPWMPKGM